MVMKLTRNKDYRAAPVLVLILVMIVGFVTPFAVTASEEDEYLRSLNQEASKVNSKAVLNAGSQTAKREGDETVSRKAFERDLRVKYAGSAAIYSKLPVASQEEIYQDYQAGTKIPVLRKKIMDRFLHR